MYTSLNDTKHAFASGATSAISFFSTFPVLQAEEDAGVPTKVGARVALKPSFGTTVKETFLKDSVVMVMVCVCVCVGGGFL